MSTEPEQTGEEFPNSSQRRRHRRKQLFGALLLTVVVTVAAGYSYHHFHGRYYEETEDAYVDGDQVQIGPLIAGTVTRINVKDGDLVEQGQILVELDPSDTAIALEQAKADLAATVRRVRGLFSDVDSYRAQVETRKVELDQAHSDFERRRKLAAAGAVSQEEMYHARDTLGSAENALTSARQQLSSTLALVEGTTVATHPEVQAVSARLHKAYIDNARTRLAAPVGGYVAKRSVQPGARVEPGAALMAVIPLHRVWVDANFKETQIRQMRIGQPVEVTADLYGKDVEFRGHIESIGVGTGSAFALLPAQNASGNWIKIIQRVPVRIALENEQLQSHPLRLGLSTRVKVDLHRQTGQVLPTRTDMTARYSTDIYDHLVREANRLSEQLIKDNSASLTGDARVAAHNP